MVPTSMKSPIPKMVPKENPIPKTDNPSKNSCPNPKMDLQPKSDATKSPNENVETTNWIQYRYWFQKMPDYGCKRTCWCKSHCNNPEQPNRCEICEDVPYTENHDNHPY
jgi:hypothetical protein